VAVAKGGGGGGGEEVGDIRGVGAGVGGDAVRGVRTSLMSGEGISGRIPKRPRRGHVVVLGAPSWPGGRFGHWSWWRREPVAIWETREMRIMGVA